MEKTPSMFSRLSMRDRKSFDRFVYVFHVIVKEVWSTIHPSHNFFLLDMRLMLHCKVLLTGNQTFYKMHCATTFNLEVE